MATLKVTATLEAERTTLPGPMLTLTTPGRRREGTLGGDGEGGGGHERYGHGCRRDSFEGQVALPLQLTWRHVPRRGPSGHQAQRVTALATFPARRWPLRPLLPAAWSLTDRVTVREALYVALAQSLEATLLTTDERLRRTASAIVAVAEPDGP